MRNALLLTLLLTNILQAKAQTLTGTLAEHKGQEITLQVLTITKQ